MKYELAQSILQRTMKHWSTIKRIEETNDIQIISEIKYDDYQQYTHGMRYIESLALWMRQFDTSKDKDCAYDLVKKKLVYISEEEMRQLVTYAFPLKVKKYLMDKTREFCDQYVIKNIDERRKVFHYFKRSSLFLGLSDGAHMDFFRRQNSDLSNEQVFVHYDFSESKSDDMKESLEEDDHIKKMSQKYAALKENSFSSFFLLDDFSGSGISYIRKDEKGWHGKIKKFFDRLKKLKFDVGDINVHLILYVSTERSLNYIRNNLEDFVNEIGTNKITVEAIQVVQPINWLENKELKDLLRRNYEHYSAICPDTFVDRHFEVGGGKEPFLGFADCSLPLVLYHNTPNNSFPVLWYSWNEMVNALFMRITRHKEN